MAINQTGKIKKKRASTDSPVEMKWSSHSSRVNDQTGNYTIHRQPESQPSNRYPQSMIWVLWFTRKVTRPLYFSPFSPHLPSSFHLSTPQKPFNYGAQWRTLTSRPLECITVVQCIITCRSVHSKQSSILFWSFRKLHFDMTEAVVVKQSGDFSPETYIPKSLKSLLLMDSCLAIRMLTESIVSEDTQGFMQKHDRHQRTAKIVNIFFYY